MTTTIEEVLAPPDERTKTVPPESGDHDRFAHYAPKHLITQGAVYGTSVKALCGKRFVPMRDPSRYPICPECKEKLDQFPAG